MFITVEQLESVKTDNMEWYKKKMLKNTIKYAKKNGGKVWINVHVLKDFNIGEE